MPFKSVKAIYSYAQNGDASLKTPRVIVLKRHVQDEPVSHMCSIQGRFVTPTVGTCLSSDGNIHLVFYDMQVQF